MQVVMLVTLSHAGWHTGTPQQRCHAERARMRDVEASLSGKSHVTPKGSVV